MRPRPAGGCGTGPLRVLGALVPVLALAACGAPPARPVAEAPAARLSSAPVTVDGRAFTVAFGPAGIGRVPGPAGATPVAGRSATVQGIDAPLGQADGLIARRAVTAACADGGGRWNDRVLGRFAPAAGGGAGAWVFDGGCA